MRANAKPIPLFFSSGLGSRLVDVDNNEFIDYTLAWGPLILGHSHPAIISAVGEQLKRCQAIGAQSELELLVSKKICEMVPCADRVVFSNTGTEAVQVAFRLARAFTGRRKILRFEGHYHGWLDDVLIGYRPAPATSETRTATGASAHFDGEMIVLPWNNLQAVETLLKSHGSEIAALITEPILCNCSCLMPAPGYLEGLRSLATKYGVLLIFDEVITGFRVAAGGAQSLFGVTPDLATFGKAVAGGFPLSVVAGKADILALIEQQKVVHAGTFNGNPISLAAALATLEVLTANGGELFDRIRNTGDSLISGIRKAAKSTEVSILINGVGSAFNIAFSNRHKMLNYRDTLDSDLAARDQFVQAMLGAGIYLLPDSRWYVSAAHTAEDVRLTLDKVAAAFSKERSRLSTV